MISFFKKVLQDFSDDECGVRAAALAYYTIFALPPLLVLLMMLVGMVWDPAEVQTALETQFSNLVGADGGRAVHDMLVHARRPMAGGFYAVIGVVALLVGALGAFMQLQGALNRAWGVKPDPTQGGIR